MYTLFIGNKNYSSWSLRGWLATRLSGAPFREVKIQLSGVYNPDNRAFSPTALVPALHDGEVQVWDSLAISEYLAERHRGMWPDNAAAGKEVRPDSLRTTRPPKRASTPATAVSATYCSSGAGSWPA